MTQVTHDVRQFPILALLSIAATVLGAALIVEPALPEESPALSIMPLWGVLLWGFVWLAGGLATTYGLLQRRVDWESAGCTLQGGAYLTTTIVTVIDYPPSPLCFAYLSALAAGFLWRAYLLRITL